MMRRRIRVLMFGWEFPPRISGGLGTACYGITRGLTDLGAEIVFVMPRLRERILEKRVKMVSAYDIPHVDMTESGAQDQAITFRQVESGLMPYGGKGDGWGAFETGGVIERASDLVCGRAQSDYGPDMLAEAERYGRSAGIIAKEEEPNVIHGHDWMTVHAGIEARRSSGKPYIYHVHSLEYDRSGENINRGVYDIERWGLESADHIISVSLYTKMMIAGRYGIKPEKITVVHNAVSRMTGRDRFRGTRKPQRKIVLFLGRITFQKGPDIFIEVASRVLQKVPEAVFVMAGSGDMMPEMIEKVARMKIGRHFHFTGFMSGEEVERMYAMSDVYVMPSVSEPFGITPLEAMISGVPVIVSRQSGVSEIVKHALKVDFWDVNEWSNKIIAVLTHPALAKEMTKRAGEDTSGISWVAAAEKIISVYDRVCG